MKQSKQTNVVAPPMSDAPPTSEAGLKPVQVTTVSAASPPPGGPPPAARWPRKTAFGVATLSVCVLGTWGFLKGTGHSQQAPVSAGQQAVAPSGIPVNAVLPRQKVLERTLTLPVSVRPAAQAELYAKTPGYLKAIQKELPAERAALLYGQGASTAAALATGTAGVQPFRLAALWQLAWDDAPEKDIGSPVVAGERLLGIDSPELLQDVAEKESVLFQRLAELEAARTAIATYEAAVLAAKAQEHQAQAEIQKSQDEHTYRVKQYQRILALVRDRSVPEDVADEKYYQVKVAQAAWESSKARAEAVKAEQAVLASKLATAQADLRVKEALVRVARDGVRRAQILADYTRVRAPFDGVITARNVDVGDLIQNGSSGQGRSLMTISSVDQLRLVAQVPERDAPWVHVGSEAVVHDVDALEGWELKGRVARVGGYLDADSRTMQVEIDLENADHRLLPGMYGQVTISLQKIPGAYAVPATAVFSSKGKNFLILVEDGVAKHQPIRIRYDDGRELEVVKLINNREVPLNGRERVVVSNKGEIGDGQRVVTAQ